MGKIDTLAEAYEIIIDEIDMFMENLYKEQELVRSVIEQIKEEQGVDLGEELMGSSPIDATLGRIDNLKTVMKTIAFQNHNLNLFTQSELDADELLRMIVEPDHEVF